MLIENGLPADDVLLDWNESPLGPPPAAIARVVAVADQLHRYPRGLMDEVTALAAEHLGVSARRVLLTAGVDEAIDILLSLATRAFGVRPGFDGFSDRCAVNGTAFVAIPLNADWQPAGPPPQAGAGDVVFLAQPNNPTGTLFDEAWIAGVRATAQYVLIDETYQEFSSRPSVLSEAAQDPGLLVYRSFSKAFGLAGIRVGCLIGDAAVIARLEPARRFMPIDAVSLSAAAGALSDPGQLKQLTEHVLAARPALAATLRDSGLFHEVRDTEANFVMARPAPEWAACLAAELQTRRIRVKACDSLGLSGWMRVSVGTWDDQRLLAASLANIPRT